MYDGQTLFQAIYISLASADSDCRKGEDGSLYSRSVGLSRRFSIPPAAAEAIATIASQSALSSQTNTTGLVVFSRMMANCLR